MTTFFNPINATFTTAVINVSGAGSVTDSAVAPLPSVQAGQGGSEFTGGFTDRTTGAAGATDVGTDRQYTADYVSARRWMRFGLDSAQQLANDKPYWSHDETAYAAGVAPGAIYGADPGNLPDGYTMDGGNAYPDAYQGVGVFSGAYMPAGVTSMFAFGENTAYNAAGATTSGPLGPEAYDAALGSYDMSQLDAGEDVIIRFSFNLRPQESGATVEVGIIWQTRDADDNETFTFALTDTPITFGAATAGQTYLLRPTMTAYLASLEDVNARALPAIRSDAPCYVQPLSTLFRVGK